MVNYSNPLVPEEESVFPMTKTSQLLISVLIDSRKKLAGNLHQQFNHSVYET